MPLVRDSSPDLVQMPRELRLSENSDQGLLKSDQLSVDGTTATRWNDHGVSNSSVADRGHVGMTSHTG